MAIALNVYKISQKITRTFCIKFFKDCFDKFLVNLLRFKPFLQNFKKIVELSRELF